MATISIQVNGKVQGVGFRASAKEQATQLQLTGWVKNETDGSLLITASGDPVALDELVRWCATGPSASSVESVNVTDVADEKFTGFTIK